MWSFDLSSCNPWTDGDIGFKREDVSSSRENTNENNPRRYFLLISEFKWLLSKHILGRDKIKQNKDGSWNSMNEITSW